MSYTEVTEQSWFSRLGNAFKGIVVGVLLLLVSFPLLFWNEGRAVHQAQALSEGRGAVIPVGVDRVDPAREGQLVAVTGKAVPDGALQDAEFGVSSPETLRLRRQVEMYQWQETSKREKRKKVGGGEQTVTTYSYKAGWADDVIDSSGFKEKGHENPGKMPYEDAQWNASPVHLGAFVLGDELLDRLSGWTDHRVDSKLPAALGNTLKPVDGGYFRGADPASPRVGDVRIRYQVVPAGDVSLVGVQSGTGFKSYKARSGSEILHVVSGRRTADELFAQMESANTTMTWVLRLVGFGLMFLGLAMILNPLSVLADVVPFFGNLVGFGTALIAFTVAASLSLLTVSLGWIAYRPLVGIPLLGIGVAGLVAGIKFLRRKQG